MSLGSLLHLGLFDDAERDDHGLGAEARSGLAERKRGCPVKAQPLCHHGDSQRHYRGAVDLELGVGTGHRRLL